MRVRNKNKKLFLLFVLIPLLSVGFFGFGRSMIASEDCADYVIISEIYGGGGNSGADYKNDFIELYNPTDLNIDLTNWSVQYAIPESPKDKNFSVTKLATESDKKFIKAKTHYLVQEKTGTGGMQDLPISDVIGIINLSATDGKVALVRSILPIKNKDDENVIDFVGYGKKANDFKEVAALSPSNTKSISRKAESCFYQNTSNNFNDFEILDKPTPQNSLWKNPEPKVYSKEIRINELLPDPAESKKEFEFIELYNYSKEEVDLLGWVIEDKNSYYNLSGIIKSGEYFAFYDTVSLNNNGDEIKLLNPNKEIVSHVSYEESEKLQKNYSYSFDGGDWKWTSVITTNKENEFDKIPEKKNYSSLIYINEILPNAEEEYIELYDPAEEDEDLSGWILRDKSKTGEYIFSERSKIEAKNFLVIYKKDFKFALNNSGKETVSLYNPDEILISQVSYDGAKKDISYNFNGADWRWSRFLTPGAENIFNNVPEAETKKKKKYYANTYSEFSAEASDLDNDRLKFTWDFGDGHKSYKPKTRHKYENPGKYTVTLIIFDGSEEKMETFEIEVKKFPRPKVKITEISPNPEGKDSDSEWIKIENKSKKEINLKNWSVATGWKKLINHPITDDFIIESGETKKLTREFSKFTLNNKKSKIELRYPDGKAAYEVKYKNKEGVGDDEIYKKTKGKKWEWEENTPEDENINTENESIINDEEVIDTKEEIIEIPEEFLGGQSVAPGKKDPGTVLAGYSGKIKNYNHTSLNQNRVLGASTVKMNGNSYAFVASNYMEDHYAVKFFKELGLKINIILNEFILMFN